MEIYFSSMTCSFYPSDLLDDYDLAGTAPSDLVKLNDAEISMYFCKSAPAGKMIGCVNGRPEWVDLPAKTQDELVADVQAKISTMLASATDKIAPLQDAVDLGMATEAETASLTAWKTYRVAVNRVPTQSGYPTTIDWPTMPT